MKIIGITGGIGSGKSTVTSFLKGKGYHVVDADRIARDIVKPGSPVLAELVAHFGKEILMEEGSLNREALAAIAFSENTQKEILDRILDKRIAAKERLRAYQVRFIANRIIEAYGGEKLDANKIFDEMLGLTERLGAFVGDTTHFLNVAATQGKSILLEGAQATLLDVDHGTYPFVTSSSTIAGGAIVGTGLAPNRLTGVLGIVRTYTTRVGEGPFPTEMVEGEAEMGQLIRERGREYGASTGRPRRCGWFDAFATRYAAEINGFTSVALTKLDVLDALEEIKVCVGYKLDGRECESLPAVAQDLRRVEPVYETLPGWQTSTVGTTEMSSLPANARRYVDFLSEKIGVEIGLVSTGPERTQTIVVNDSAVGRWLED